MRTLEDALSLDTEYRMLESGSGFLAKIDHNRRTLGVIKVDGITLPGYGERYLNVGMPIVGLCGLALNNARTFHDVQGITHELQKSEELFRNLATLAPIGIALTDDRGKCGYVNDAWCGVFGLDHRAALNDGWIASLITDERQSISSQWQAMVDSGEMWAQEFTIINNAGRQVRVLGRAVPLYEEDGTIKAYIAVIVDVTEQRHLEERLRRSREMESVGQLSAGIAHEFNNILTAIIGYANLLTLKIQQDDSLSTYAERIIERAERAADLAGGLLSFGRQQIVFQEEINLVDCVQRMEPMVIASAGPNIECRMAHEIDTLPVLADEVRLQQVVGNLVCNARDAMPDGGTLSIETSVVDIDAEFIRAQGFGRMGAYAVITVTDTGKGMSPKTMKRIFEPFFTTKEVGQGPGLGLAVVDGIIKQHNGYVAAASEEGKGSTFRIYLPLSVSPHQLQP
jgi:PAS domain S-box-containing protein